MLRVIAWRVWYEDAVYDSRTHEWSDLPDDGVQVMVLWKSDFRRMICCGDSSYWKLGDLYASNMDEPPAVAERYPGAEIKRGKWLELSKYETIRQAAAAYEWNDGP